MLERDEYRPINYPYAINLRVLKSIYNKPMRRFLKVLFNRPGYQVNVQHNTNTRATEGGEGAACPGPQPLEAPNLRTA